MLALGLTRADGDAPALSDAKGDSGEKGYGGDKGNRGDKGNSGDKDDKSEKEPANGAGPVALRRRLRRVQTALDRAFGTEGALLLLDADRGRAVVPGAGEPPEGLGRALARACGRSVRIAAVPATGPGDLPGAARTAGEILRVARACGRPPGVHVLDDVLLEYHLTRPGESGRRIAALLDPVADRPELIETLRTHLALRQERRATAAALGLHPNTVDNRLSRTAEQTGLDVTDPRGAALALAALLLRERN
ncbi:PucR family transcriptional regulator [Streptomyces sp. NPDC002851]